MKERDRESIMSKKNITNIPFKSISALTATFWPGLRLKHNGQGRSRMEVKIIIG